MDTLRFEQGQVWYQASAEWGMDRAVYYQDDYELVPLLPAEVPFLYDSEQLVFLWDRVTGIALATSRQAAWVVVRDVPEGPSAVALFGEKPEDMGYTHEVATGATFDCGPYPTAGELIAEGFADQDADCSFVSVASCLYECQRGSHGIALDQLDSCDVIGGISKSKGFGPSGITATAFTAATDMATFSRLCVVGAESVDFGCLPTALDYCGEVSTVDLKWFGHRTVPFGCVGMGMVTVGGARDIASCVEVKVGPGVDKIYWIDKKGTEWITRAASVEDGLALIATEVRLCGLYVFTFTAEALGGTVFQPIKYTGLDEVGLGLVVSNESQADEFGHCYEVLLHNVPICGESSVTWDYLVDADLIPRDKLSGYSVVKTATAMWHVTKGIGLSVLEILDSLRHARGLGCKVVLVDGYKVRLTDHVGAPSAMSVALKEHVLALRDVHVDVIDAHGGRLSGFAIGLLGSGDKIKSRMLQAIGDNALSLALAVSVYDHDGAPQEYQELRSQYTSNACLAAKFSASVFRGSFQDVGPNLSPKTGGGAMEMLVGTVYLAAGLDAVRELLTLVGIHF